MDGFWHFAGNYWWLIFVIGGPVAAALGRMARSGERYAERRQEIALEKYRIKHGAEQAAQLERADGDAARAAFVAGTQRLMDEQDEVQRRWLAYELDAVAVLEYPVLTDMREEVTVAFHRAKRLADSLRPAAATDLVDPPAQREYRDAVHAYATAFDVAEAEARRVKQGGFREDERARLATALRLLNLALDESASPAERQSAYQRVRREIDGLLVLPEAADDAVRRRIAALPTSPSPAVPDARPEPRDAT